MDVCRSNPFPAPCDASRPAFLEFGSTTIKLYFPKSAWGAGSALDREAPANAPEGEPRVDEVKVPWELGYDVFQIGRIRRRTIDRCLCVLRKLQERFPDVDFRSTPAVGTAALREAANAECLQEAVRETLDLKIHVIDGAIEARLLETEFRGSVKSFPTALFDLGGGSLELVQYLGPETTRTSSLPLGAIRLHCSLEHIRDRGAYADEGRRLATASLRRHLNGSTPRYRELLGTGGTVRSVTRLAGKDTLTAGDMAHLRRRALENGVDEELEPHRRAVFLAGVIILQSLFAALDVERITYTEAPVPRGLLDLDGTLPRESAAC